MLSTMASLYDFSLVISFAVVLCQVHGQDGIEVGSWSLFFILLFATASVGFFLNKMVIANNSYVDVDDIGANETALLCHTDKSDGCGELPS